MQEHWAKVGKEKANLQDCDTETNPIQKLAKIKEGKKRSRKYH